MLFLPDRVHPWVKRTVDLSCGKFPKNFSNRYSGLVGGFAPADPIRDVKADSIFMWTSSKSMRNGKWPSSISFSISFRPVSICHRSSGVSNPALSRAVKIR